MDLPSRVAQAFQPGGAIAASVEAYQPRQGQLQMAAAVAQTMEAGGVLVVEAGTGVGKTYAYLVPALLSGERVLVSTATKALQDQLFSRDIPRLIDALGIALRVAMLKGRSSYLCLHRTMLARQETRIFDEKSMIQLGMVERWSQVTQTGDLTELQSLEDTSPVIPWITSTRENCLGSKCPSYSACHVNLARREAMAADLVVVNHHLFFADLNVRESGVAELLPSVRSVVFDESHQLNEVGVQFLGRQFSTGQLLTYANEYARTGAALAGGFGPWKLQGETLAQATKDLIQAFDNAGLQGKLDWSVMPAQGGGDDWWHAGLDRIESALQDCAVLLSAVAEMTPDLEVLRGRAAELREQLVQFSQDVPAGFVRWLEVGMQVRLVESPLDIARAMRERVLPPAEQASLKSWLFTSATLGHEKSLSWFVERCGLQGATVLQVPSPFDYAGQAGLFIPPDFPKPAETSHSPAVAALALQGACVLGGRTMVLTTTLRAMREIGQAMRRNMPADAGLEILIQGERPKRELLERFVQGGSRQEGAVLVASATFWEGIDVPGDALQLLVVDKLPFAPPDDPLQQARAKQLEAEGRSAFRHLHLPYAAVALKQGAGRLIRRESDRGLLVVCDVRLIQMGYGRQLLSALPPMTRLTTHSDYLAALTALAGPTRPSTRGLFEHPDP